MCVAAKRGACVSMRGCVCMCVHTGGQELSSLIKAIPKGAFLSEAKAGRSEALKVPLSG